MDLKIDFSEYLKKGNRFFRIGFDNLPAEYLGYSGFLLTEPPKCTHHTRDPPTATHITPDTLSTQTHLPPSHQMPSAHKHTHTNTPTPITPVALMRHTTIATPITPDTLLQLPTLHQISTLSMHPKLTHITPDALSTQPQLPTYCYIGLNRLA